MKNIFNCIFIFIYILFICSCNETKNETDKNTEFQVENKILDISDERQCALEAAYNIIATKFVPAQTRVGTPIIEETSVPHRFKVEHVFKFGSQEYWFRMYIQNFGDKWEYGLLEIETYPEGKRMITTEGDMKKIEQSLLYVDQQKHDASFNYKITKQRSPNYVTFYTDKKLNRKNILELYDLYKDQYEIMYFTDNPDPDMEEYLTISGGCVFDYRNGSIKKIQDY